MGIEELLRTSSSHNRVRRAGYGVGVHDSTHRPAGRFAFHRRGELMRRNATATLSDARLDHASVPRSSVVTPRRVIKKPLHINQTINDTQKIVETLLPSTSAPNNVLFISLCSFTRYTRTRLYITHSHTQPVKVNLCQWFAEIKAKNSH